jgi:hypothetical protein
MIAGLVTIQDWTSIRCIYTCSYKLYTTIATSSIQALWLRVAIGCDVFSRIPAGLGPWVALLSNMFLLQVVRCSQAATRTCYSSDLWVWLKIRPPQILGFINVYHCLSMLIIICPMRSSNSLARHLRASNPWMPGCQS